MVFKLQISFVRLTVKFLKKLTQSFLFCFLNQETKPKLFANKIKSNCSLLKLFSYSFHFFLKLNYFSNPENWMRKLFITTKTKIRNFSDIRSRR